MATIHIAPEFLQLLKLFNLTGVKYLLVGGYAVGFYGYPRATGDFDLWIATDDENARKAIAAMREHGFDLPEKGATEIVRSEKLIRFGDRPIQIDVLSKISGVAFDECYDRRKSIKTKGVKVDIISLEDLKINKRASGRYKDLNDLLSLP